MRRTDATTPLLLLLVPLVLVLGACGDEDDDAGGALATVAAATSITPATSPTTTAPLDEPPDRCTTPGSSPATFDAASGTHAAFLTALDADGRRLSFDVVRWLEGREAVEAYHREVPDDPDGPPNDYYVTNDNPAVRTAPVADEVRVRLLATAGGATLVTSSWQELPEALSRDDDFLTRNPFWLTMRDGAVVALCQQYVP